MMHCRKSLLPLLTAACSLWTNAIHGQSYFSTIIPDAAWTWYNDPRALYHNDILYVGYVRNSDGASSLSAFNPGNGIETYLWGGLPQRDDHNNPGLLAKQDGAMLALYARHAANDYFAYRLSTGTNPVSPADWTEEQTFRPNSTTNVTVTYSNPYQLAAEGGKIYNFLRNLNFNPNVVTSTDGGATWSPSRLLIQKGTSAAQVDYRKSVYVKFASNFTNRIDFLYTDGHPRHITNSLYHAYYQSGGIYKSDGSFLKSFDDIPLLHDSGELGTAVYQYSTEPGNDPDSHIPSGRAWCWEIAHDSTGAPVCVFTVQSDDVTPGNDGTAANFTHDRIYYYYARWTGAHWQKRFIAHAGRPLYNTEDDYAGGICLDPRDPNVIYLSTSAAEPFNLSISNTELRANDRYELFRGVTANGGLTFTWTQITSNSPVDNLRPYVPRRQGGPPTVLWFRGTYTSMHTYRTAVVGIFPAPVPQPPSINILSPLTNAVTLTNRGNDLILNAEVYDDGLSGASGVAWTTASGPANAIFSNPLSSSCAVRFPRPGGYLLRLTATNSTFSTSADLSVQAGTADTDFPDPDRVLWLKLDESAGSVAGDSSGNANHGALSTGASWQPAGGMRSGAIAFDGVTGVVNVADAPNLDNTGAFTLAYWFRANAFPPDSAGLVSKRDNRDLNNSYTTYLKAGDRRIYVDIDQSNNRFPSAATMQTGVWYHVALVFDGSLPTSQRAELWINGQLDVTAAEASAVVPDFPSTFEIGHTASGVSTWFNGSIDDVRFYRRALSPVEILALSGIVNAVPSVRTGPAPAITNSIPAMLYGLADTSGTLGPLDVSWSKVSGAGALNFGDSNAPATTITANRAVPFIVRLAATNMFGAACQDIVLQVQPNPGVYEDWLQTFFPGNLNEAVVGIIADPDADGEKNMVEFALGLSPSVPDALHFVPGKPGVPVATIQDVNGTSYLVMEVQRPADRLGISYQVEVSEDLLEWQTAVQVGTPVPVSNGMEVLRFRDIVPVIQAGSRFIRLRIDQS